MNHSIISGCTLLAAALLIAPLPATHPEVSAVYPRGARQDSEVTLEIYGQRLQSIQGITFFKEGIEVLQVTPKSATRAQVRIRITKGCPLGGHPMLIRTARGYSSLHMFFVGTLAEVSEEEPNDKTSECRAIKLESTVNGRIKPGDLDVFAIDVTKGQQINIEVQGLRLGDQEFDPHLEVTDSQGKRLAAVDDTILGHLDPLTSIECQATGRWYITLRENARGGSSTSFYRMHVGTFPRPLVMFPAGGKPGQELKVRYLDDIRGFDGTVKVPAAGIHKHFTKNDRGTSPTPLHIVSSNKDNRLERSRSKQASASAIGPWSLIGPFANPRDKSGKSVGQATPYPPEQGFKADGAYKGRDSDVSWKPQRLPDNAAHDLKKLLKKSDNSVVYLSRNIETSTARRALCILRADDSLTAWCNQKLMVRTQNKEQRLILDLRKGSNRLLLKVSNRSGSMNFFCRILDPRRLNDHRAVSAPVALNGIIDAPGQRDRFVFLAKANESLDFRVVGRRVRSPIDPSISIYCTHQSFFAGNDDSGDLDSLLKFRAPFTGEFVFRIGDALNTASPLHVYRVEVAPPSRAALVTRSSLPGYQYEWSIDVPQGGRSAIMISTTNLDRKAGTQLAFKGLPDGVKASIPRFARGATSVPVVFSAATNTELQGQLLDIDATATIKGQEVKGERFRQAVPIVEARNRRGYLSTPIDRLPMAVTRSTPFSISAAKLKVPLIRNSSITIPVDVQWTKDFKGTARIRMLYNPPGITAGQVVIKPGQARATMTVYANASVATEVHKVVLIAFGTVDGAVVSTSTGIIDLEVDKPWIQASIGKARSTPNTKVELGIDISHLKKYSGKVETSWIGIPRDIQCGPVKVSPTTGKLTVPVKLGPKAPPGRHRAFRLRMKIHTKDGVVTHDFRSGEIRIDRPVTKKTTTK